MEILSRSFFLFSRYRNCKNIWPLLPLKCYENNTTWFMNTANENILVEGTEVSIERISFKAGFIVSASLIIYFMVMQAFHLVGSGIAWGFNFVILSIGLVLTYRTYRSHTSPNIDYFPGVILGAMTTAISTVVYVLFVYFYLSAIDQESLVLLKDNW